MLYRFALVIKHAFGDTAILRIPFRFSVQQVVFVGLNSQYFAARIVARGFAMELASLVSRPFDEASISVKEKGVPVQKTIDVGHLCRDRSGAAVDFRFPLPSSQMISRGLMEPSRDISSLHTIEHSRGVLTLHGNPAMFVVERKRSMQLSVGECPLLA